MFNKEDMTVSLAVAEQKIESLKAEKEEEYEALNRKYKKLLNFTKGVVGENGLLIIMLGGNISEYEMGIKTDINIDEIEIYTGDELQLEGKKGIVVQRKGFVEWVSNKETCAIKNGDERFTIVDHFINYKDGQEVARGRKGHAGFLVRLGD